MSDWRHLDADLGGAGLTADGALPVLPKWL
jgi:hypothetical protein